MNMTVKDAVNQSIEILNGIMVPVGMKEMIADPIAAVVNILHGCIDAFVRADEEQKAREAQDHGDSDVEVLEICGQKPEETSETA